jgi:hypothetical protein
MKSLRIVLLGHHLVIDGTGIRPRRLRSQLPSQCVRPMRMGRSKSRLVPESYGPSRHLCRPWSVALLQVRMVGLARTIPTLPHTRHRGFARWRVKTFWKTRTTA